MAKQTGKSRKTSDTPKASPTRGKESYKNPLASMSFEGKVSLNAQQKAAIQDIFLPDSITVLIGEAGTGKTLAAMYAMFKLMKAKEADGIVITRPTVEAGGRGLGFQPGDLDDKFGVYLQPIRDFCALLGNSGDHTYTDMRAKGMIEPTPLQFMRGTTSTSLLLADEMQNSNEDEMLMVLTRVSEGSRLIITGDMRQKDTKRGERSGLDKLLELAPQLPFIKVHHLTINERHPRIRQIVGAWDGEKSA